MSEKESSSTEKITYNSKSVLLGLFSLVGFILLVFFIAIISLEPEEVGRLNPVFIAAISGTLALGGTLVSQLWGNKTGTTIELKPAVIKTIPFDTQAKVHLDTPIIASFNRIMDKETINSTTFTLKNSTNNSVIDGTIELIGADAKFTPNTPLNANTKYIAKISKDVKDISGNNLVTDKNWSFITINQ
jgi:hypothetical protein